MFKLPVFITYIMLLVLFPHYSVSGSVIPSMDDELSNFLNVDFKHNPLSTYMSKYI